MCGFRGQTPGPGTQFIRLVQATRRRSLLVAPFRSRTAWGCWGLRSPLPRTLLALSPCAHAILVRGKPARPSVREEAALLARAPGGVDSLLILHLASLGIQLKLDGRVPGMNTYPFKRGLCTELESAGAGCAGRHGRREQGRGARIPAADSPLPCARLSRRALREDAAGWRAVSLLQGSNLNCSCSFKTTLHQQSHYHAHMFISHFQGPSCSLGGKEGRVLC